MQAGNDDTTLPDQDAKLNQPSVLALLGTEDLVVGDKCRVRLAETVNKFDKPPLTTIAGSTSGSCESAVDGVGTNARFADLGGLAFSGIDPHRLCVRTCELCSTRVPF